MTFWDDNATPAGVFNVGDMYDEYTARQADFIIEQLDVDSGTMLDLGCGIGRLTLPVARSSPSLLVIGTDPSPAMHLEAKTVEGTAANVIFFMVDRVDTMQPALDGAWCVLTFQHLPDDTVKQHLADLSEILKPGARLVTQWVTEGEEAPMSYPRTHTEIRDWHFDVGFPWPTMFFDAAVTRYSDEWLWVTAEKPA